MRFKGGYTVHRFINFMVSIPGKMSLMRLLSLYTVQNSCQQNCADDDKSYAKKSSNSVDYGITDRLDPCKE